jgi:uncharacterized membrane protein YgdD (TMEM256/DUF423 family)
MNQLVAWRIAAATGFLAVALGAFGAHGLSATLEAHGTAEIWGTAAFYHLVHAVVLLMLASRGPFRAGVWLCFFAGVVIFSGTLYVLAATNTRWLGAITPLGGVALLAGWGWLLLQRPDAKAMNLSP